MNDFTTRQRTPTGKEYLEASWGDIVERLNRNPSGHMSEFPFVQNLIAIRSAIVSEKLTEETIQNARVSEKLTKRLNLLTGVIAVATVFLVAVPFFTPSYEKKVVDHELSEQAQLITDQSNLLVGFQNQILDFSNKLTVADSKILSLERSNKSLEDKITRHNQSMDPTRKTPVD